MEAIRKIGTPGFVSNDLEGRKTPSVKSESDSLKENLDMLSHGSKRTNTYRVNILKNF